MYMTPYKKLIIINYLLYILNTACSDGGSPNVAHKCALPMLTENHDFLCNN